MTTMLEKVKAAILTELEDDHFGAHEAGIAARAALLAIREPNETVSAKGASAVVGCDAYDYPDAHGDFRVLAASGASEAFTAIIDAILSEKPEIGTT